MSIHLFKSLYSIGLILGISFSANISPLNAKENAKSISFGLGTGMWQEQLSKTQLRYINTIEVAFRYEVQNFTYQMKLPVFIPFDNKAFIFGTPNQESGQMFSNLSSTYYLSAFIKKAVYHTDHIRIGLEEKAFHFNQALVWGNPLFHAKTPFLGPNFYFNGVHDNFQVSLFTSSLQEPSLMLFIMSFQPFKNQDVLWLKELKLETSLYTDMHLMDSLKPVGGGALNIETYYWGSKSHALGIEANASYGGRLFRSSGALLYRFSHTKIGLGGIWQDKNHPSSPLLSSLSPGFQRTPVQSNEYIPGGTLFVRFNRDNLHTFDLSLDVYSLPDLIFSYRVSYGLHLEKIEFQISFIRNKIALFKEIVMYRDQNAFFGFDLKAPVLDGLCDIGWSAYLNWDWDTSSNDPSVFHSNFKSRLYTHITF